MRVPANTPDEALLEPLHPHTMLHIESGDTRLPLVVSREQAISPTPLLGVRLDSERGRGPAEPHATGINCIMGGSVLSN